MHLRPTVIATTGSTRRSLREGPGRHGGTMARQIRPMKHRPCAGHLQSKARNFLTAPKRPAASTPPPYPTSYGLSNFLADAARTTDFPAAFADLRSLADLSQYDSCLLFSSRVASHRVAPHTWRPGEQNQAVSNVNLKPWCLASESYAILHNSSSSHG